MSLFWLIDAPFNALENVAISMFMSFCFQWKFDFLDRPLYKLSLHNKTTVYC